MAAKPRYERKPGRPTHYTHVCDEQVYDLLATHGWTQVELAKYFGISVETLNEWKRRYKKFSESYKAGQEVWDNGAVEKSLKHRALGVTVCEVKEESDDKGRLKTTKVARELPADISAIKYWLGNRDPNRWKDKTINVIEGEEESPLKIIQIDESKI